MNNLLRFSSLLGLMVMVGAGLGGCGGGSDDDGPPPVSGSASEQVSTGDSGYIVAGTGASIFVPEGAVPLTLSGTAGTVTFSTELASGATPPTGVSRVSDVYAFGPEGMTFAAPVDISIPLSADVNLETHDVSLYRINPATGEHERYPSTYDPETDMVSAQTHQFSPWYIGITPRDNLSDACFIVNNTASGWRTAHVHSRTLKYPEQYNWPGGQFSTIWPGTSAASNSYGSLRSSGKWFLMQGSYTWCIEENLGNGQYRHGFISGISNMQPWAYLMDTRCSSVDIGGISLSTSGRCDSAPIPTPSFGTGDLQVTLVWHSSPPVDLDLYVTEPNGTVIYYGNETSTSGGALDRDNMCDEYIDGQPENIFWSAPPTGQYKIEVDYWGGCESGSPTSVNYSVRVVNKGTATTYNGSVSEDRKVTVGTITVR